MGYALDDELLEWLEQRLDKHAVLLAREGGKVVIYEVSSLMTEAGTGILTSVKRYRDSIEPTTS